LMKRPGAEHEAVAFQASGTETTDETD